MEKGEEREVVRRASWLERIVWTGVIASVGVISAYMIIGDYEIFGIRGENVELTTSSNGKKIEVARRNVRYGHDNFSLYVDKIMKSFSEDEVERGMNRFDIGNGRELVFTKGRYETREIPVIKPDNGPW